MCIEVIWECRYATRSYSVDTGWGLRFCTEDAAAADGPGITLRVTLKMYILSFLDYYSKYSGHIDGKRMKKEKPNP